MSTHTLKIQIFPPWLGIWMVVLAMFIPVGEATASVIEPKAKTLDGIQLHLEGEIQIGDAERFEANFEYAKSIGLNVIAISLNSPGGKVAVGAAMARSIRARGLRTMVEEGATCASACFMLFAAGKERIANENARIGVHSAVTPKVGETETAKSATIDSARLLAELGVPSTVLGKMVTTKPTEMAWLTRDDLRMMRVNTTAGKVVPGSYVETATPTIRPDTLPLVVKPEDAQKARDLFTQAQSQLRANAPQKAIPILERATELDPYDPFIASMLGYSLHMSGKNKEAREALQLALQIKKDYAEGHRVLALVAASLGEPNAARDHFTTYYRKSSRADLALSYLSDLAKSEQVNSSTALAARAALTQLNIKP